MAESRIEGGSSQIREANHDHGSEVPEINPRLNLEPLAYPSFGF